MTTLLFQVVLPLAALFCSLTAGFLFAFAVVVMPGIRELQDGAFLRAFQVIDRVIQNNQPLFIVVWAGSVLAVVVAAALGIWAASGVDRVLLVGAALIYLCGVQLPTIAFNLPLNNQLQRLDVAAMSESALHDARSSFEARWNRWNVMRTIFACLVSVLFVVILFRT